MRQILNVMLQLLSGVFNSLLHLAAAILVTCTLPFWLFELGRSWAVKTLERPQFYFPKDCPAFIDWMYYRHTTPRDNGKDVVRIFGVQFRYT